MLWGMTLILLFSLRPKLKNFQKIRKNRKQKAMGRLVQYHHFGMLKDRDTKHRKHYLQMSLNCEPVLNLWFAQKDILPAKICKS